MNALNVMDCFLGGPWDGVKWSSGAQVNFPRFVGREYIEDNGVRTAVYEFVGNRDGAGCVERMYRLFETMTSAEARVFLAEHQGLTSFAQLR